MNSKLTEFSDGVPPEFETMANDILSLHFVLIAKREHGKSTSLKTFIKFVKQKYGDKIIIKIFDVSQSWFHCAPVGFRQYITMAVLESGQFVNAPDCVYEMGELEKDFRRGFVGEIIRMDYQKRQQVKKLGGEAAIKALPLILYVLEEANTYFDSNSLIRKDAYATILNDFVSVGRNYGLGGVLVVTRMKGELAPGIRERCNLLIGRISGDGELRSLSNSTNKEIKEIVKSIKKFHWIYWNGERLGPFRVRDLVSSVPTYLKPKIEVQAEIPKKPLSRAWVIIGTAIATFIACLVFFRL